MSNVKTRTNLNEVRQFLEENLNTSISELIALKGGEISQAYSFESEKQSFIVKIRKIRKINANKKPFLKELNAYNYIRPRDNSIPIPKILKQGIFLEEKDEKYLYCISEKATGSFVHTFPQKKYSLVDPTLIEMLQKIHRIDISDTNNYGYWQDFDKATSSSWQEFILDELKEMEPFLEKIATIDVCDNVLLEQADRKIKELLPFTSEKRYLVHGDYGFDNTLADEDGNITAVFDWEHSIFGDFVYDIAWLDFWKFRPDGTYAKLYRTLDQAKADLEFVHYEERLLCYKLYIGITAASFFIDSEQMKNLLATIKNIESLL